jgi:hypothetical protein
MGNGAGAHLERTAEVFWTTGATAAAVMEAMMNEATVETRLVGARKVHRRINTAGPQVRRPVRASVDLQVAGGVSPTTFRTLE